MQTTTLTVGTIIRQTGALILLVGIACIPSIGQEIALGVLIVMACGDPARTLKSLVAGTVVTFINPSLASASAETSVLASVFKWLLLFVCFARSLQSPIESTKEYRRLFNYWAVATVVLLINSFIISDLPQISAFKAISFSLGVLCVIRLATLTSDRNEELLFFVATLGTAISVASLPLLPFAVGHSVNGSGFNGALSHPQGLGIFLVMTGSAAFATAFRVPRLRGIFIALGLAQWSLIYFTGSRTALVAIALGGIVYLVETVARNGRDSQLRYLSTPILAITIAGFILAVAVSSGIRNGFVAFLQKGHAESFNSLDDPEVALRESSRASQISDDLELAEAHPLFGSGFGVDEDSESNMAANGAQFAGIPLSAPAEQGFLPLATVAQIGIIGSAFVFAFLLWIYRLTRLDSGETSALFAAVLGVNFGEMIFYSIGGWGILMWTLLILYAVSGAFPQQFSRSLLKNPTRDQLLGAT